MDAQSNLPIIGFGNCEKMGHQYQIMDDPGAYGLGYPAQASNPTTAPSLQSVYGGRYVKHLFCGRCGEYKNVELKCEEQLKPFLEMNKLQS